MRDWFLIELGLYSGLRVFEMAKLCMDDMFITTENLSFLIVRDGKGKKTRTVYIAPQFQPIYASFLQWRTQQGHAASPYLFYNLKNEKASTETSIAKIFQTICKKGRTA